MQLPDYIDIEHPERYGLATRITPDEFAFCIYELQSRDNSYYGEVGFSTVSEKLEDIMQIVLDSDFLTFPFLRTDVIFVSEEYDLVPNYIIQKEKKEILYNFTHHRSASQVLYSEETIQQIATVFNANREIYEFLSRNLNNPGFHHHTYLLMQYIERRNKMIEEGCKMYLNFHDDLVDIICYGRTSQILHAITHRGQNEKNLVYHILNMWDKCGYDQNTDTLFILNPAAGINLYIPSILSEYIRQIKQVKVIQEIRSINDNIIEEDLPLDMLILTSK